MKSTLAIRLAMIGMGFMAFPGMGAATVTEVDLGSNVDQVLNLVPQPDGKLLACARTRPQQGSSSDEDIALVRFGADGLLDPGFGSDGIVIDNLGGAVRTEDAPSRATLGAAGTIWVNAITSTRDWVLLRYGSDGVRQARVDLPLPPSSGPLFSLGLAIDGRNRPVLSSLRLEESQLEWRTARHDPGTGITAPVTMTPGLVVSQAVGSQRILTADYLQLGAGLLDSDLAVAATVAVDPTGFANEVARRGDRVVLAGTTDAGFAVATVRPGRETRVLVLPEFTSAMAVTFDDAGRILAGGTDGDRGILVRVIEDSGQLVLDSTFARGGVKRFGRVGTSTEIRGLHVADGRLYAVGHGKRPAGNDLNLFLAFFPY